MELAPALPHGAMPASEEGVMDDPQKYSRETSSSGGGVEAPSAKQNIIEVPNGQSIDGQPQQPGPQYKRGRGRSFFKDAPRKGVSCQVPGCDRSLHKLRDYYKICPYHLDLNCMVVEGQSIRFCQQCGRFQLLDEFDGDRRSCRRKLEKHNERRRKLEGSLTDSDSGGEGSGRSRSGLKYHRSGSPPRPWGIPPLPLGASNGIDVNQMLQNLARDEYLMKGFGPSLTGGVHSLTSGGWMPSSSVAGGGGVAGSTSNGGASGAGSASHMHPDLVAVLAEVAAANTIGGMSISHPQQQQQQQGIPVLTSEPAHPTTALRASPPSARPGVTGHALQQFLRDNGCGLSNGVSTGTTNATNTVGRVPIVKSEPMSLGAAGSAFAWPPNGAAAAAPMGGSTQSTDAASALPINNTGVREPDNTRVAALAAAAAAASADDQQHRWGTSHVNVTTTTNSNSNGTVGPGAFHPSAPAYALSGALGGNPQAPVVNQLMNLLRQLENASGPRVPAEQDVMTLSLKLFKMTPAQLPPGLLHELTAWMTKTPTYSEIAMRPGCVHLTTSILSTSSERAWVDSSVSNTVRRALTSTGLGLGGPATEALLLQMQSADGPKAAIVLNGVLKMVLDLATTDAAHRPPVPSLFAVRPLAAMPEYTGSFLVLGQGMDANQTDRIFCSTHGRNAQIEVINRGPALLDENNRDASGTGGGWLQVAVPHLGVGGYAMEVARGPFVSSPVGFVVLDDPIAVAEVRQLESDADGVADVAAFIQKLGIVVQLRKRIDAGVSLTMEIQDETVHRIAQVAQEIASVCLKKGWPAVLSLTLSVLSAAMPAAQGMEYVSQLLGTGVTPLSAAVVSGNAAVIEVLGAWATLHGISLMSAEHSTATLGMTALHFAAMLNEPCVIASALNKWVTGASGAWNVVPPTAGVSALSIAASLKQEELLQMLVLQGVPSAAEALEVIYKERNLMCPTPDKAPSNQKIDKFADIQNKFHFNAYKDNVTPRSNSYGFSTFGYDDGASSSNSSSVRCSRSGSPNSIDDLSRAPSLFTPLSPSEIEAEEEEDGVAADSTRMMITATEEEEEAVAVNVSINSNGRSRGRLSRRTGQRIHASDATTGPSSAGSAGSLLASPFPFSRSFSLATTRSFISFLYMLLLTVLLPALLPERIALGAAVLPAVVVASFASLDQNGSEMAWSMLCAALMTLMAVSLNKSGTMAQVRARAFEMLCASPRVRAIVSTLWLLSVTKTLRLGKLQKTALFLINITMSLIPLPAVISGKEAWLRMTGAAMVALMLAVCLPMTVSKLLGQRRRSEEITTTSTIGADATGTQETHLLQRQEQHLDAIETKATGEVSIPALGAV